jgi:hypothetical protein
VSSACAIEGSRSGEARQRRRRCDARKSKREKLFFVVKRLESTVPLADWGRPPSSQPSVTHDDKRRSESKKDKERKERTALSCEANAAEGYALSSKLDGQTPEGRRRRVGGKRRRGVAKGDVKTANKTTTDRQKNEDPAPFPSFSSSLHSAAQSSCDCLPFLPPVALGFSSAVFEGRSSEWMLGRTPPWEMTTWPRRRLSSSSLRMAS